MTGSDPTLGEQADNLAGNGADTGAAIGPRAVVSPLPAGSGAEAAAPPLPAEPASEPAARRPLGIKRSRLLGLAFDAVLILLIGAGVVFRFSWVNWNEDADLHPDEYGLTGTLTQLAIPATLGEYFNTRISPLSPYQKYDVDGTPLPPSAEHRMPDNRMRWGQWPLTIIRWMAEATGNTGYGELRLMGRRLSALADTLALGVIFLIGWRLHSRRVGLMAAALSALSVMQIQQAHFMTADNFGTLFTALAMYAAVRVATGPGPAAATDDRRPSTDPGTARPAAGRPPALVWYGLFGLFFGLALASRINLAPLAAEIVVAAVIAYAVDWQRGARDRGGLLSEAALRLGLAGLVAVFTFRVAQPMSFRAETGDTTLLTLNPNPEWLASMAVAQAESSGEGGGPPGEQWTDRPALVFPFVNMVVWGMGLPLGLMAWAGLLWAAWRSFQPADEVSWKLHALPLTWAGGYFLFMGTRWVKSIRYFLPIYPFMALLAAWAIVALWKLGRADHAARQAARSQGDRGPQGRAAEGAAFDQRTSPSRRPSPWYRRAAVLLGALVLGGTLVWAWGFTSIYRNTNTRVTATRWVFQNVPAPLNLQIQTMDGLRSEPLSVPDGLTVGAETPYRLQFSAPVTGTLTGISAAYASTLFGPGATASLQVVLAGDPEGQQPLAAAELVAARPGSDPRGAPAAAALGPATLVNGQTYYLLLRATTGAAVQFQSTVLAHEEWDEALPIRMDGRDPFGGMYRGLSMLVRGVDDENKRQMFISNLAQADLVILPSQRGLWSASRLPNRYPLTLEYYRALFDGRLGFELAAQFQSPIRLGPLQISSEAGTWAWGHAPPNPPPAWYPFNDNPLAAEEAFSVYDHAPVWIFKKRADFSLARVEAVLNAVDLSTVVNQGPREATRTPTLFRLPPDRLAELRAGGTWSAMFDFDGLLNRHEWLGVLVWYLAVLLMGWAAFPLAFVAFSGLPDRGYPLAKTFALLVTTWLVWLAASYRVLPFNRGAIALSFAALAAGSALVYHRRRAEINAFVFAHRRALLVTEGLTLALFAFDLLLRWGNPDLWHPNFGGEKPMVFSFFNAVLKSESFPPYNPWLAGYALNYYYYGFVIVAMLTKLLGIVPAFAYNLILPTLFALVGGGAYSVAYNLVAAKREAEPSAGPARAAGSDGAGQQDTTRWLAEAEKPAPADSMAEAAVSELGPAPSEAVDAASSMAAGLRLVSAPCLPRANPYLAGIAAAMLVVVLGNLAQVHTFLAGFQDAADPATVERSLLGNNDVSRTLNGFWRVATGATRLPVGTGDWYWDATRIVTILLPENSNEITEFPFFTFLYADLHAHMIDLPFTLLSLGWALSYLLAARQGGGRRDWLEWGAVWLVGGLALGAPRATNTWDYPLFLALGVAAVAAGEWRRAPQVSRATLFAIGWRVALLAGLALACYQPFDQWFAAAYGQVKRFEGNAQPISAYLYIYGLFLFIVVSFLGWETVRWLAETPATVLTRAGEWLPPVVLGALALVGAVGVSWFVLEVPIGVITLPLMTWAGLLLLRPGGSLPLAKRAVLFLIGAALAMTLFVEVFVLEGDRMNTIFKFYIQVWVLLSVAGGAALAWVWSALPRWPSGWRTAWTSLLAVLVAAAALYTVTASAAKTRDRFPGLIAQPGSGCSPIAGMALPYDRGLPVDEQPHSLYGLDYMTWSAYCDHDAFLPLAYDHEAIRWLQDNVGGSPVIVEAQSFDLYRMSSRYTWNTGLPDVVGWDYHTRQHNAAIPTEFITQRGTEITSFYTTGSPEEALAFLHKYDARYVIVGPMEQAYYAASGGLAKFNALVARGDLSIAYQNPGVTIFAVTGPPAAQ
ncbi:MAG: glycosyltransferase family 39 protein [Anaerolineales bacterium]|nr:glycosyltransferase family 39 protein [Anaerolineales bacterium]